MKIVLAYLHLHHEARPLLKYNAAIAPSQIEGCLCSKLCNVFKHTVTHDQVTRQKCPYRNLTEAKHLTHRRKCAIIFSDSKVGGVP